MINHIYSRIAYRFQASYCKSSIARSTGSPQRRAMSSDPEFLDYMFGPWPIRASEVFLTSSLSYAFVNLKPVVPGHILISSKRVVHRYADLTPEEASDLWKLAHQIAPILERHYSAASLTLAIQDGQAAGQTVPHVHIHVLPRKFGDFEHNDLVYDAIDDASKHMFHDGEHLNLDGERKVRTSEEMAAEATELRQLFK